MTLVKTAESCWFYQVFSSLYRKGNK